MARATDCCATHADANKVYFAKQEGAVEKLLAIIGTCWRNNGLLCDYAIRCIWNFASIGSVRFFLFFQAVSTTTDDADVMLWRRIEEMARIVLELGFLETMFPLMRSDDQDLVASSIGCLWGFLEFGARAWAVCRVCRVVRSSDGELCGGVQRTCRSMW
jgi:hypothetical protein